jgi:signal peptidase I
MSAARLRVARAALTRAVRGRGGRGTDWGESMLRELDETNGGWESVRWAASGLRVARRDRLRHLPESRPLGALPPHLRVLVRALAGVLAGIATLTLVNQFALTVGYQASASMTPGLGVGDRFLVDRVSFRFTGLDYGDVVAFDRADDMGVRESIKRVVGLAGDVVSCVDGRVLRNGTPVDEGYLAADTVTACDPVTVEPDHVFVLGDNRAVALDSRQWGTVAVSDVVGRVIGSVSLS